MQQEINKVNEIYGVYILKFICALMVIRIHTESFMAPGILPLCRIAVPVFFICSGFFLPNERNSIQPERIKKSLKKIFYLWFTANLIYMIVSFLLAALSGDIPYVLYAPTSLLRIILKGDTYGFHLWYLMTMLQAYLILLILVKLDKLKYLLWFTPVLIMVNLWGGFY